MMRRRIFLWMGFSVLLASLSLSGESVAQETYQVLPADTLSRIAKKTGVSLEALQGANELRSTRLKPGQILVIPSPETRKVATSRSHSGMVYRVRKGDTLAGIARKTGTSVAVLRDLNRLTGSSLSIGMELALQAKQDEHASLRVAPLDSGAKALLDDQEEEEDDGIAGDEATAGVERQARAHA